MATRRHPLPGAIDTTATNFWETELTFGVRDITLDLTMLSKLVLIRVGFYPGSETHRVLLDYSIDRVRTLFIIAVALALPVSGVGGLVPAGTEIVPLLLAGAAAGIVVGATMVVYGATGAVSALLGLCISRSA